MEKRSEFMDLINQIENCKGYKLDSDAHNLEGSFKLMVINYGHLKRVVEETPTFSVEQRDEKDKYMMEATRCFMNYLSSAGALRDHTRKFIRNTYGAEDSAFGGEYKEKIKAEFADDPLSQLIEELRNHYCHQGIPPVGIMSRVVDGSFKSRFVVFLDSIDVSDSPKAKQYIEQSEDDTADVLELSDKYTHKSVFPWIIRKMSEYHNEEFEELERLREKARKLQ